MILGKVATTCALAVLATAIFIVFDEFKAQHVQFTPAPRLAGNLRSKPIRDGVKYVKDIVQGAESIVAYKDAFYTFHECNGSPKTYAYCGRPLGIRHWHADKFLVADAIHGIYVVDYATEKAEIIFSAKNPVGGIVQKFPDDLDIFNNDTIFYSDASTKWTITDYIQPMLEHGKDGRIIQLTLSTGEARVLVEGISFPNGVQVHPDRQSILFSESATAKIHRYYFTGPRKGQREVFCDSLPGFPDNIRRSASGKTFYVALFSSRWRTDTDELGTYASLFDFLASHTWLRTALGVGMKYFSPHVLDAIVQASSTTYGLFVELDLNGQIVDSYHDPNGLIINSITEVMDDGGQFLYLGSFINNYIGRVRKH